MTVHHEPVIPATEEPRLQEQLGEWRRRAVDVFMRASALAYLPGIALMAVGAGPKLTPPMIGLMALAYFGILAGAALRRLDYRLRIWIMLGPAYLFAIAGVIAIDHGPFMRVVPVAFPMIALVLIGTRSGRFAMLASAAVILFSPFLRLVPFMERTFGSTPFQYDETMGVLFTQGMGLLAMMAGLMLMLEGFHKHLINTLAAQGRAIAEKEREAAERAAAHRKLAREMEQRQRLEHEIARIGDEERRRLGQDVHDGVCQQLTGALLRCQALERRLERGGDLGMEDLGSLSTLMEEAIDEAHAVAKGLCPLEPHPDALAPALRMLTKRIQGIGTARCEFIARGDVRVEDPVTAQHLYRIAQEALSNAARHSQAAHIVVELCGNDGELVLEVRDDGVGLPDPIPEGRMGLRTMAYRAQIINAELTLAGSPGQGVRLACRVSSRTGDGPDPAPGKNEEGQTPWILKAS